MRTLTLALLVVSTCSAQDRKVFFGHLHAHTSFSDGSGTPDEAYTAARAAGLHFFAITEHNHSQAAGSDGIFLNPTNYHQLKQAAEAHTKDGEFVAMWGQEISTISSGNHQNIFYASEICNMPNGNFKFLYENWLPAHSEVMFVQLNHPKGRHGGPKEYGLDDYGGDFKMLLAAADQHIRLIEVVKGSAHTNSSSGSHKNGKYEDEYRFYLNKGFHLAPSVGGDNHKKTWGKSMEGRMGVWAKELTRGGIEDAIFNHHCYASEDDSAVVQFSVNENIMGSFVGVDGPTPVTLKVEFSDTLEPTARYRVMIFHDDAVGGSEVKQIENQVFNQGVTQATFTHTAAPGAYYFAKVVQFENGHSDDIWTAPIWITEPIQVADGGAGNTDDPPRDVISWDEADDYIGETVTVKGKIVRAHNHEDNILFLNFHPNFRETLSLVVFASDFSDFGGATALSNRLVNREIEVRGKISMFRNTRLQMKLQSASQIIKVEGE